MNSDRTETPADDRPGAEAAHRDSRYTEHHVIDQLHEALRLLTADLVTQVVHSLPNIDGRVTPTQRQHMRDGAEAALGAFMAESPLREAEIVQVRQLFVRYGQMSAEHHWSPKDMLLAISVGSVEAYRQLSDFAAGNGLPADIVNRFLSTLMAFGDSLRADLLEGYEHGINSPARARDELWMVVSRSGASRRADDNAELRLERIRALGRVAAWPVPASCVVIATEDAHLQRQLAATTSALVGPPGPWQTFVLDADTALGEATRLADKHPFSTVLVSWPTPVNETAASIRWVRRLGRLVDAGVIPRYGLVSCEAWALQLLLHADPALRRFLTDQLLQPLLDLRPHDREILAETMLDWLQTHDSAIAIATRRGLHPQTIRVRLRRIAGLFGSGWDAVPRSPVLTAALQASVPLWRSDNGAGRRPSETTSEAPPAIPDARSSGTS